MIPEFTVEIGQTCWYMDFPKFPIPILKKVVVVKYTLCHMHITSFENYAVTRQNIADTA